MKTDDIVFLCECRSKVTSNGRVCAGMGSCAALISSLLVGRSQGSPPTHLAWALGRSHSHCTVSAEKGFVSSYKLTVDDSPMAERGLRTSDQELPHTTQNKVWWFLWVGFLDPREGACERAWPCAPFPAPSPQHRILLDFLFLDTECTYDYLFVYDGDSPQGPLLASLSGSTRPPPIEASSGKVSVVGCGTMVSGSLGRERSRSTRLGGNEKDWKERKSPEKPGRGYQRRPWKAERQSAGFHSGGPVIPVLRA